MLVFLLCFRLARLVFFCVKLTLKAFFRRSKSDHIFSLPPVVLHIINQKKTGKSLFLQYLLSYDVCNTENICSNAKTTLQWPRNIIFNLFELFTRDIFSRRATCPTKTTQHTCAVVKKYFHKRGLLEVLNAGNIGYAFLSANRSNT